MKRGGQGLQAGWRAREARDGQAKQADGQTREEAGTKGQRRRTNGSVSWCSLACWVIRHAPRSPWWTFWLYTALGAGESMPLPGLPPLLSRHGLEAIRTRCLSTQVPVPYAHLRGATSTELGGDGRVCTTNGERGRGTQRALRSGRDGGYANRDWFARHFGQHGRRCFTSMGCVCPVQAVSCT